MASVWLAEMNSWGDLGGARTPEWAFGSPSGSSFFLAVSLEVFARVVSGGLWRSWTVFGGFFGELAWDGWTPCSLFADHVTPLGVGLRSEQRLCAG